MLFFRVSWRQGQPPAEAVRHIHGNVSDGVHACLQHERHRHFRWTDDLDWFGGSGSVAASSVDRRFEAHQMRGEHSILVLDHWNSQHYLLSLLFHFVCFVSFVVGQVVESGQQVDTQFGIFQQTNTIQDHGCRAERQPQGNVDVTFSISTKFELVRGDCAYNM